ncbi:U7 snRNA-associated Sm-like protein LSm10 [Melipona quadrifasciata]|uniref:U7 snRNA-associated Sm-like protein LSm10 n=1 Tax=Melipona quadrifasciata TaxID=166423 RepID=A0A0M8ZYE2_9HYME|nr:U7 snRNA-associated Sm-like protein LSm10 [Melipona quadrifasciata]
MTVDSKEERYFYYNSLAILLKAVENERTTIDLRNEASVYGTVEHADAYMNVVMKNCVFTDPRGDSYSYTMFFVQARNIRFVHIPPKVSNINI